MEREDRESSRIQKSPDYQQKNRSLDKENGVRQS